MNDILMKIRTIIESSDFMMDDAFHDIDLLVRQLGHFGWQFGPDPHHISEYAFTLSPGWSVGELVEGDTLVSGVVNGAKLRFICGKQAIPNFCEFEIYNSRWIKVNLRNIYYDIIHLNEGISIRLQLDDSLSCVFWDVVNITLDGLIGERNKILRILKCTKVNDRLNNNMSNFLSQYCNLFPNDAIV